MDAILDRRRTLDSAVDQAVCANCRWLKTRSQFGREGMVCTLMPRQMLVIPQALISMPVPPEIALRNPNAQVQAFNVNVEGVHPPVAEPAEESCVMFEPKLVALNA